MESETKPLIYLIEDEESISKLICLYLTKENLDVKAFIYAEDALTELNNNILPEMIILDLNLPGKGGFEFLKLFREKFNSDIPVMIVSARDADEDIINGLNIGADEFVTKPFSPSVLVARVKANLRRQSIAASKMEDSVNFGSYSLLLNSCVLKKGSQKVPLSVKEYEVLEYLITHAGEILSPEKIYNDVWKFQYGDITAVAVYIQRLRKKLSDDNLEFIKTEFGKGYIFNKDYIK